MTASVETYGKTLLTIGATDNVEDVAFSHGVNTTRANEEFLKWFGFNSIFGEPPHEVIDGDTYYTGRRTIDEFKTWATEVAAQ